MNKVILSGQYYPHESKSSAHKFSIRESYKKDGEWKSNFYKCVSFGKSAEHIQQFFRRGQVIEVDGHLSVDEWETSEGQKRSTMEIIVERSVFPPKESKSAPAETSKEAEDPTKSWDFDPFSE